MGSVKKAYKKLERGVKKTLIKPIGEVVEEVIEKPVKKIGKETFDIVAGTTDEERRAILYGETPTAPATTPEVTPEVVPDETLMASNRRRTRGKRSGGAGTILEGYGTLYASASPKAPTGG